MTKLSQMADAIKGYIAVHGDKDISSIGTYNSSSDLDYGLTLYDVYNGPAGSNPYNGRDVLYILKNGTVIDDENNVIECSGQETGLRAIEAYFEMVKALDPSPDTPVMFLISQMGMIQGALSLMRRMNAIDAEKEKELWDGYMAKARNIL